ncbi:MAG TPA: LacI family DNA-binding transcriptional regulator [Chthoniobacteraceae bacterium]|nr:LacI family DNA-binding transcriptional regulator [Chthoniobacteraceae bacterium]
MKVPSSAMKRSLRPSERVMRFLESGAFPQEGSGQEVRLPSMREVAAHLQVSVSTVVAVYRELTAAGRIRTEVGNGSFLLAHSGRRQAVRHLRIAINLSSSITQAKAKTEESWYYRVFGGIMMAGLETGEPITIHPIGETPVAELEGRMCDFDILLVCPGGFYWPEMVEQPEKLPFSTLFLNPPHPGATRNFVSADYHSTSKLLGKALRENGRRRILFLANGPSHKTVSENLRIAGLMAGIHHGEDRSRTFHVEFAEDAFAPTGMAALGRFIEEKKFVPDAIYTGGDFTALGCLEELERRGIACPQEVSVVGGSGLNLDRSGLPHLTRTRQPFEQIGRELIAMAKERILEPERDLPGQIIPMGWLGGATTTQKENGVIFG